MSNGHDPNMWQLFLHGIQGGVQTINIHKDASVDDLLRKFGSKQLEAGQGKHLSDYYIENNSNLFVVLRLHGGADPNSGQDPPPSWVGLVSFRNKPLDEDVELTDDPDMITWDDDKQNKRAKMPCGHAIGPESLTAYCASLLTAGKYRFLCPYISPDGNEFCQKEWEYVDVRRLAVLSPGEKKRFETSIATNYLRKAQGIQECPQCKTLCERVDKKNHRVVCIICHKQKGTMFEFCWYCLHEWKTKGSITQCGNTVCSGKDPRLKILQECPKKNIVGVDDCPSRRACPGCGMLIEHEKACKHMACTCGQRFCFICLKAPSESNGEYQCGSYNSPCTVAPIQTKIPGSE
ncbi:uncharacterized protein LOC144434221 [Glandiceps talaboti]